MKDDYGFKKLKIILEPELYSGHFCHKPASMGSSQICALRGSQSLEHNHTEESDTSCLLSNNCCSFELRSPRPSTCFLTGLAYLLSGPGLGVLARYSWGKMLTFGGHHGVTLMQIRHMAVAGFSSFINFQVSMAESIIVCRSSLAADLLAVETGIFFP